MRKKVAMQFIVSVIVMVIVFVTAPVKGVLAADVNIQINYWYDETSPRKRVEEAPAQGNYQFSNGQNSPYEVVFETPDCSLIKGYSSSNPEYRMPLNIYNENAPNGYGVLYFFTDKGDVFSGFLKQKGKYTVKSVPVQLGYEVVKIESTAVGESGLETVSGGFILDDYNIIYYDGSQGKVGAINIDVYIRKGSDAPTLEATPEPSATPAPAFAVVSTDLSFSYRITTEDEYGNATKGGLIALNQGDLAGDFVLIRGNYNSSGIFEPETDNIVISNYTFDGTTVYFKGNLSIKTGDYMLESFPLPPGYKKYNSNHSFGVSQYNLDTELIAYNLEILVQNDASTQKQTQLPVSFSTLTRSIPLSLQY